MARHAPAASGPADPPASRVVDPVDHGVFKGDPPPGLFGSSRGRRQTASPRHSARFTGMILERVSLSGAWRDTDSVSCSSSSASRPNAGPRGRRWRGRCAASRCSCPSGLVDQLQRTAAPCRRLSSGSPMPMSTMLEMGRPESVWAEEHLVQHLRRRQVPDLAADGGGAEGAAHPAAHLRGDADGVAVVVAA